MREVKISARNFKESIGDGLESVIYLYEDVNYYDHQVLYKRFRSYDYIKEYNTYYSENSRQNKYEKIQIIPSLNCFKDEVQIMDIGMEYGKFQGYVMKKCPLKPIKAEYILYECEHDENIPRRIYFDCDGKELTIEQKIRYLKLIKEKIVKLNNSDVYIGDFNFANFLTNKNIDIVKLCDLDSLKIGSHDFDNKHPSTVAYEKVCMPKNDTNPNVEGLDSFCFNIFTLALLTNQSNYRILKHIDEVKLPKILDKFPNQEILEDIKHLKKSYKPRYFIDIFN